MTGKWEKTFAEMGAKRDELSAKAQETAASAREAGEAKVAEGKAAAEAKAAEGKAVIADGGVFPYSCRCIFFIFLSFFPIGFQRLADASPDVL